MGSSIFVVEDDDIFLTMLQKQLASKGYKNVEFFKRGEDCLKVISKKPKAVVLDFSLDGLNGLDVLREIRKSSPKTKVIILTAHNDDVLREKCLAEGAVDYIVKDDDGMKRLYDEVLKKFKKSSFFPF